MKCTQTSDKDLDKVCKVAPDVPNDAHSPSNLVNNTLIAEDADLSDSLTHQSGCDSENLDDGNFGVAAGVENLSFHADSISSTLVPTEGPIVTKNLAHISLGTDSNVYYHELDDTPGLCVEDDDGALIWPPTKISRSRIRGSTSTATSDSEEIDPDLCSLLYYQLVDGMPGIEVETDSDVFWAPIAHRTRTRTRLKSEHTDS